MKLSLFSTGSHENWMTLNSFLTETVTFTMSGWINETEEVMTSLPLSPCLCFPSLLLLPLFLSLCFPAFLLLSQQESFTHCRLTKCKYLNVGNHFKAEPLGPSCSLSNMNYERRAHRAQRSASESDPPQLSWSRYLTRTLTRNWTCTAPVNSCHSQHLSAAQGRRRTSNCMHGKWGHCWDEEWKPRALQSGGIHHIRFTCKVKVVLCFQGNGSTIPEAPWVVVSPALLC